MMNIKYYAKEFRKVYDAKKVPLTEEESIRIKVALKTMSRKMLNRTLVNYKMRAENYSYH